MKRVMAIAVAVLLVVAATSLTCSYFTGGIVIGDHIYRATPSKAE